MHKEIESIVTSSLKLTNKEVKETITRTIKISVIIPTYFEEKILENLLTKLNRELKKTYNFEVIVSDGGSTDKTLEIAKNYADKVVEKDKEGRQTIAEGRNAGREVAVGDILVFLNADCEPKNIHSFFDNISKFIDHENEIAAIACKVCAFQNEELLRDKIFYYLHNNYVRLLNAMKIGMGRGECQIIRRDVFDELNGYNSKLVAGEDFDLYRRIAKSGKKIRFSKDLLIMESARRFRKYGYIRILWQWTLNSLSALYLKKSASKEWEAVR